VVRLHLRAVNEAAKQRLIDVMLREVRVAVAEEIAEAIMQPQQDIDHPEDQLQQVRDEQARIDAALARRIGRSRQPLTFHQPGDR
jgi:hypothetical protein